MVNGIVNVYKEKGYTSFDVVAKMRGIMHQKKIGHTGTLDPDAEGVLPVCLGKATKVCELLTDKDKIYEATLLLGVETDTLDISGKVLNEAAVEVSEEQICEAIHTFVGGIMQVPPMYSALKVNGQKLCDLARKGITVERKARPVHIFSIDILEINIPEVKIKIHCSKGTYIRTLCDDIGKKLGCYGCMKDLIRTKVSAFELVDSLKLEEIENMVMAENFAFVRQVDSVFESYASVYANSMADKLIKNGNKIPVSFISNIENIDLNADVRLYTYDMKFVGIYRYNESEEVIKPVKIFMD